MNMWRRRKAPGGRLGIDRHGLCDRCLGVVGRVRAIAPSATVAALPVVELTPAAERHVDRSLAIVSALPLVAVKTRLAKQRVDPVVVRAGPERQQRTQRKVGGRIIVAMPARIASP